MSARTIALAAALALVAACGTDNPEPDIKVSVLKLVRGGVPCRALLPSDDLDKTLDVGFMRCPDDAANAKLVAGGDQITVVVDYGTIEFAEGATVPAPTLTTTFDGIPADLAPTAITKRAGHRAFFEFTFTVPARPNTQLSIAAVAATGVSRTLEQTYALTAPLLEISVEQCHGMSPCELTAATDNAAVHVTAGASSITGATLVSIVDGVSQPTPLPLVFDRTVDADHVESVNYLPVPAGGAWSLYASVDQTTLPFGPITLIRPGITVTLACGASCAAGAQSTLVVTAPRKIHPAQATVTVTIGNVPLLVNATVALTTENIATDKISGSLAVTLTGTAGKTVVVDALAAGFPATTLTTTLQ